MTIFYSHPSCLDHNMGEGHPERPARIETLESVFKGKEFASLERKEADKADLSQIGLMHPNHYIEHILGSIPLEGKVWLDSDTCLSPGSGEAALCAAGAACAAIDSVMSGYCKNAFCAVRPPGHHAESSRAMGFCLFNNIAIAAGHARAQYGVKRVAVIDFDVHHGNGTQEMFWSEPDFFFASTHQMPLYPGTGAREECGDFNNVLNVPLRDGDGSNEFRAAISEVIIPGIAAFEPELLLVSAGFDAHTKDPLAGLNLCNNDYAWVTEELMLTADKYGSGRLVSVLEGGYDLEALSAAASAHVLELLKA